MKEILTDDQESRLNTLRKIFNIDKYKKIKENTLLYIKDLKAKRRELEVKIEDLDQLNKRLQENQDQMNKNNLQINELTPKLNTLNTELNEIKTKIEQAEEKIKRLNENKKQLDDIDYKKETIRDTFREKNSIVLFPTTEKIIFSLSEPICSRD